MGVLVVRALLFGVYIRAPDFLETSNSLPGRRIPSSCGAAANPAAAAEAATSAIALRDACPVVLEKSSAPGHQCM